MSSLPLSFSLSWSRFLSLSLPLPLPLHVSRSLSLSLSRSLPLPLHLHLPLSLSLSLSLPLSLLECAGGGAEIIGVRMIEEGVQSVTNVRHVLYTSSAYRFGSRPYVTDCPAQRSHHIATIGDKRCVRSRWRCARAVARGIAKLASCISAAIFTAVRLDKSALAQKLRQRR